ncbi:hypothetical protein NPIL_568771 [Nephila pilipes]|uniref:Uncharacterized protein n=1 Tax=Nephila pilipes TaxID=299642 RepID=A0A8X6QYQ0_NEPPI|nr:hypothetical protein NPIL_568771 [Nephila pilipes]
MSTSTLFGLCHRCPDPVTGGPFKMACPSHHRLGSASSTSQQWEEVDRVHAAITSKCHRVATPGMSNTSIPLPREQRW